MKKRRAVNYQIRAVFSPWSLCRLELSVTVMRGSREEKLKGFAAVFVQFLGLRCLILSYVKGILSFRSLTINILLIKYIICSALLTKSWEDQIPSLRRLRQPVLVRDDKIRVRVRVWPSRFRTRTPFSSSRTRIKTRFFHPGPDRVQPGTIRVLNPDQWISF